MDERDADHPRSATPRLRGCPPRPVNLEGAGHGGRDGFHQPEGVGGLEAGAEPPDAPPGQRGSHTPTARSAVEATSKRAAPGHRDEGDGEHAPRRAVPEDRRRQPRGHGVERDHREHRSSVGQGPAQHELDVEQPVPQDGDPDGRGRRTRTARGEVHDHGVVIECEVTDPGEHQGQGQAGCSPHEPQQLQPGVSPTNATQPAACTVNAAPEEEHHREHQADQTENLGNRRRQPAPRERRVRRASPRNPPGLPAAPYHEHDHHPPGRAGHQPPQKRC